jgi:hypothetical protein
MASNIGSFDFLVTSHWMELLLLCQLALCSSIGCEIAPIFDLRSSLTAFSDPGAM